MTSRQDEDPGIEVRSYFPTPVVVARVPLSAEDNARLRETILAREQADAGVHHTWNLGRSDPVRVMSTGATSDVVTD